VKEVVDLKNLSRRFENSLKILLEEIDLFGVVGVQWIWGGGGELRCGTTVGNETSVIIKSRKRFD